MSEKEKIRLFDLYWVWQDACCTYVGREDLASKTAYNFARCSVDIILGRILEAQLLKELLDYHVRHKLDFYDVQGGFCCMS